MEQITLRKCTVRGTQFCPQDEVEELSKEELISRFTDRPQLLLRLSPGSYLGTSKNSGVFVLPWDRGRRCDLNRTSMSGAANFAEDITQVYVVEDVDWGSEVEE